MITITVAKTTCNIIIHPFLVKLKGIYKNE